MIARFLLSPFVLLHYYGLVFVLFIVPVLPILIAFNIIGLLTYPFIYVSRKNGVNIDYLESMDFVDIKFVDYLLSITCCIWIPFYGVYVFVKDK